MKSLLISALAFDGGKSGIANYIHNSVRSLSKLTKIDLIVNEDEKHFFENISENINFIVVPRKYASPLFNMLWHMFILPFKIDKKKYDWLFLPAGNRRLLAFYPIKTFVMMHDLSQFNVGKKYDAFRMFYIKKVIPFFLKFSHKIFSVSQNTADDLVKYYHLNSDDIVVNYNGVDRSCFNSYDSDERIYKKPYILYVARIEHPGKNHLNLIKAYEKMSEDLKDKYDLCLVGSDWNGAQVVHEYASKSKDVNRIKFIGYVPNEDLPKYYKSASLFAFPSFYEGFGIPLVEAMISKTPSIAANRSSLPEVGGNAVAYFNPDDPKDISQVMSQVLINEDLQKQMIEKGLKQVEKFDWDIHAKILLEETIFAS